MTLPKPRVFVVQVPQRREGSSRDLRPDFDLSPAAEWGELVRVLGDNTSLQMDMQEVLRLAETNLEQHNFSERDFILLIGQPAFIGLVAALVVDRIGVLRMLQWERAQGRYRLVEARVWDEDDQD